MSSPQLANVVYPSHREGDVVLRDGTTIQVRPVREADSASVPLTDVDAKAMIRSLATLPLLEGFRGWPPADVAALEEMLLRFGALVENHPEIAEMDCNPVVVLSSGAAIVDARVRLEASVPGPPLTARRPPGARTFGPTTGVAVRAESEAR